MYGFFVLMRFCNNPSFLPVSDYKFYPNAGIIRKVFKKVFSVGTLSTGETATLIMGAKIDNYWKN